MSKKSVGCFLFFVHALFTGLVHGGSLTRHHVIQRLDSSSTQSGSTPKSQSTKELVSPHTPPHIARRQSNTGLVSQELENSSTQSGSTPKSLSTNNKKAKPVDDQIRQYEPMLTSGTPHLACTIFGNLRSFGGFPKRPESGKRDYNLFSTPKMQFAGYDPSHYDDCLVKFIFGSQDTVYLADSLISGYVDRTKKKMQLTVKHEEYADKVIRCAYDDHFAENCDIGQGESEVKKSTDSDNNLTIKFPYGRAIGVPRTMGMQWKAGKCLAVFQIPLSAAGYWDKMRSNGNLFFQADEYGTMQLMFKNPGGEVIEFWWAATDQQERLCYLVDVVKEPLHTVMEEHLRIVRDAPALIELVVGKLIGKGEKMAPIIAASDPEYSNAVKTPPTCGRIRIQRSECKLQYLVDDKYSAYWLTTKRSGDLHAEEDAQGFIQLVLTLHGRSTYFGCKKYKEDPNAEKCDLAPDYARVKDHTKVVNGNRIFEILVGHQKGSHPML